MEAILDWLAFAAFALLSVAAGVLLGLWARRRGRAASLAVLLSAPLLAAVAVILVYLSPPCADALDAPCESNRATDTATVVGFVLLPVAAIAAATRLVAAVVDAARRRHVS